MIAFRTLGATALIAGSAALATVAAAQPDPAPTGTSRPQPIAIVDTIPAPVDIAYPGTIRLLVDATDIAHGVFDVTETIPVKPGRLVLLSPKWLPGNHSPSGQADKLAGFTFRAAGRTIAWKRDPVDVTALHLDVPEGVTEIVAHFQYLSPTQGNQGRVVMTQAMLNLQWDCTALYPAGTFVRDILVQASAIYPQGWTSATALRPAGKATAAGGRVDYAPVAFDTLIDSPVFAGLYYRAETLSPKVTLNIFADKQSELDAKPDQVAAHRRLVDQAVKAFGAQHYDHYDFLFAISDKQGGIGLEHHRSSEDGVGLGYFTEWKKNISERSLLPHEFTHSWNGKFRRPADLWTPDYRTPMQDSLLWVYEGQTEFWGEILSARAGLYSKEEALDSLAVTAAQFDTLPGRAWRPLVDTTNDEIINPRRPQAYRSWQRFEDYYSEGQLIWLEADAILRERSQGHKSIDDFARAFFGINDGDWGEVTYTFDDVIATLKRIDPGYDWATFLHDRVDTVRPQAPLDWVGKGGYKLVYTDVPGDYWSSNERGGSLSLPYAIGASVAKDGRVTGVTWDGPAYKAGLAPGTMIVAIDGQAYDADTLKDAIIKAKGGTAAIALLIRQGDGYRTVQLHWNGGLRYPHLEKVAKGETGLDRLLKAK